MLICFALLLLVACSSAPVQDPVPQLPPAPVGDLFEGVWSGVVRSNRTGVEGNALATFAKDTDRRYIMQFGGREDPSLSVPITIDYRPEDIVFTGQLMAAGKPYRIVGRFRPDGSIFASYTHGDDKGIVKLKRVGVLP